MGRGRRAALGASNDLSRNKRTANITTLKAPSDAQLEKLGRILNVLTASPPIWTKDMLEDMNALAVLASSLLHGLSDDGVKARTERAAVRLASMRVLRIEQDIVDYFAGAAAQQAVRAEIVSKFTHVLAEHAEWQKLRFQEVFWKCIASPCTSEHSAWCH